MKPSKAAKETNPNPAQPILVRKSLRLQIPPVCSRSFLSQYGHLLRSSLVSKHTRLKGRVVESAGIRSCREHSSPDRWHNRPWSGWGGGRQGTDPLPALGTTCP